MLAAVVGLLALPFRAEAAPAWEVNYAVKQDSSESPTLARCALGLSAWHGGLNEWEAHATACFILAGDYMAVADGKADGHAVVMKWEFRPSEGAAVSRRGICIYTGGSKVPYRTGTCNKDLPEKGLLRISAGIRMVSGSESLSDMRFGNQVCLALNGSSAIGFNGEGCDLIWSGQYPWPWS
ncbi:MULTISPECIES: hypothetical protein [Mumia]|nr:MULTISPECIES: hypothetical protein [Mumia]